MSSGGGEIVPVKQQQDFQQALALVLGAAKQQLAVLRQPRDEFQMMADKDFFASLVKVACYLDALRFYRK